MCSFSVEFFVRLSYILRADCLIVLSDHREKKESKAAGLHL